MDANSSSRSRSLFLSGEHPTTVDEKSRILIPADFRRQIVEELNDKHVFTHVGPNRTLKIYPDAIYREELHQRRQSILTSEEEEDFLEAWLGMAHRLEWDAQGRLVLPQVVIERTSLEREIVIVGAGEYMVIRNRPDWKVRSNHLLDNMHKITKREREVREKKQTASSPAPEAVSGKDSHQAPG